VSANRRAVRLDAAVAALAGIVALAIYIRSLAPGLLWGDSAEFQMAAWLGGFAHPTGYPLYLMLGWAWTHLLPFGDPAFRMNLFSALWGAVAAGLVALLTMRLLRFVRGARLSGVGRYEVAHLAGASRLIAFGVALVFIFTPTFWSQAVVAEVYTLHAAFVAAILLAVLIWGDRRLGGDTRGAERLAYTAALLLGLSLAHHRSTILLIPGALLFAAIVLRSAGWTRPAARQIAIWLICLLAPLLLYLYIPLRAPHVPYYTLPLGAGESLPLYDSTLAGFLAHVSGSVFSSSLVAPQRGALDLGGLGVRFVEELSLNGLLLGALGLGYLLLAGIARKSRRAWAALALTASLFAAQTLFNLFYAIGDIFVFYIPAYLVWVLWIAVAAMALIDFVAWLLSAQSAQVRHRAALATAALVALALLAFAYRGAVVYWPKTQQAGNDSARRAWDAVLTGDLPPFAVLVSNDRDEVVPFYYLKHVEGRRPDVTALFPLISTGEAWSNVGRVLDRAVETDRPVRLVKPMPGLEVKANVWAARGERAGGLGPPQAVQPFAPDPALQPVDVSFAGALRLASYSLGMATLAPGADATVTLHWQPLAPLEEDWTTFIQIINANGDKVGQSDHRPGGEYYPTSLWAMGEELRDPHIVTLASDLGQGPYRLLAGLYAQQGESLRYLGEPQFVGEAK
jgi:hypothetical protein